MMAHAGHEHHDEKAVSPADEVCPVCDEVLKGDEKITYEYKGTTYHFCSCPRCPEEFKKNPEKYIDKMKKKDEKKS
jgi:YHS domain-containing protein